MKVDWKQFAQRRKLNIKAFRDMSYESYCKWCNIRGVNPISAETYTNIQKTVTKNTELIEDLEIEIVTKPNHHFDETKLKKLRKPEIQAKCKEFSIEYIPADTKKTLIERLLKLNKS
jgi:hypothetical protein